MRTSRDACDPFGDTGSDPRGDLNGLLIVSLEQAVAAPYCTRRLADAGARVIKLERREGDFARGYDAAVGGLASYFVWLNHGKESMFFDLKAADRYRTPAPHARTRRRFRAKPRSRRGRARRDRQRLPARTLSAPHHLRHHRLRERRTVPRHEGLRSPHPSGDGSRLRHRLQRRTGPRRRLGVRHRCGMSRSRACCRRSSSANAPAARAASKRRCSTASWTG